MIDILGRKPSDFDLVVKSIPNRSGAYMTLGIFKGKSIWYMKEFGSDISHCRARNFFVVKSPTKEELEIKEKLLKLMR
ncbi:hypothetical protein K144316041_p20770 (plasmid) [Clostridium tetani]|uniref:hypothetical protein n=1 Tax=Clostridium tetani TaxID=1513 RepID=UPI002954B114|nr:hypothetical protein [Clostridium tetani]BDR74238.1 hypothetical protein K144316041_p20770 [Clostridium tetani]